LLVVISKPSLRFTSSSSFLFAALCCDFSSATLRDSVHNLNVYSCNDLEYDSNESSVGVNWVGCGGGDDASMVAIVKELTGIDRYMQDAICNPKLLLGKWTCAEVGEETATELSMGTIHGALFICKN